MCNINSRYFKSNTMPWTSLHTVWHYKWEKNRNRCRYQSQILEPTYTSNITSAKTFHKQATFRRKTASRVLKALTGVSFGVGKIITMSYRAHKWLCEVVFTVQAETLNSSCWVGMLEVLCQFETWRKHWYLI